MAATCLFCDKDVTNDYKKFGDQYRPNPNTYICSRCGIVRLTYEAADDFPNSNFSETDKNAISITLRNEWERGGQNPKGIIVQKTLSDLTKIVEQFSPIDPFEKIDKALVILEKGTRYVGAYTPVNCLFDYPYYYCKELGEMDAVLHFALDEGLIKVAYSDDPEKIQMVERGWLEYPPIISCGLTTKGYQRLREIQRPNKDSNQCFVAMWFGDEVNEAFEDAIKPAIEYKEPGEEKSGFEAVRIDGVQHTNDINDEIIAQIRRSRFMVCDLTGYRGGVYFEAGFAYGLGLDVIYTCRKDWTNTEDLQDINGDKIKKLYDKKKNPIRIKKEGVHFDLAHRNRISWEPGKLPEFRKELEDRIKAVII